MLAMGQQLIKEWRLQRRVLGWTYVSAQPRLERV